MTWIGQSVHHTSEYGAVSRVNIKMGQPAAEWTVAPLGPRQFVSKASPHSHY